MTRLPYFIGQALRSLRESTGASLLTSATIAAALLVVGAYAMALINLENLSLTWGRAASVAALIKDNVTPEQWESVRARVQELDGVQSATLVTPEQALLRFRQRGSEAAALVEGLPATVLPAMIEVNLKPGFVDLLAVAALAQAAEALPEISDVDYGKDELDGLQELLLALRWAGLVGGIFLMLATAFIVSNTIRLAVYARKDEIAILELVGATPWFIRTPFLMEGAAWGLLGGLLAAGSATALDTLLAQALSHKMSSVVGGLSVRLATIEVSLAMVGFGLFLGVFGSALAVRRFLEADPQ